MELRAHMLVLLLYYCLMAPLGAWFAGSALLIAGGRDLVLSGISSVGAQRAVSVELRCEETLNCYIFIPVTGRRGFSAVGILL